MIALMFVTLTGKANDEKLSLITKKESKSLVFELESKSQETDIKLFDDANHIIYSENIYGVSYAKKFDLTKLENGFYYFTTEDSLKKITYTISVEGSDVKILKRKESTKPVFKKENGMVYLNFLNLDKKEVEIEVLDSANRLVFSEKYENELIIEKAFNFKKAFEDSYTIVVKDNDNTYFEDIVVK